MNRRQFLKTAGVTAGVALAANRVRSVHAATQKVRVGCIGTGGQGGFHLRTGLAGAQNIEVVAVCDVYDLHQEAGWNLASNGGARQVNRYYDYKEMLDKEDLDAVVIATPLVTHFPITMDCLDAGKYVFCQKTLTYTVEDSRKIVEKCHTTGKFCQVGHQRRYNPKYNRALWRQREEGLMGRINHITMQWHRNNPWRRFVDTSQALSPQSQQFITDIEKHLNWRLYKETSGGIMTELTTHQVDVANWFMGTPPSRVYGTGGLDYWRDGREIEDNIALVYEYDIKPGNPAFVSLQARHPFMIKRDMVKPYTVRAVFTSTTATGKRGASEMYQGDKASVELTEEDGCFIFGEPAFDADMQAMANYTAQSAGQAAKDILSGKSRQLDTNAFKNGWPIEVFNDKPVDQLQFEAFGNDVMNNTPPKANQMVGLMTAIAGIAATEAVRGGGKVVEIDPKWYAFDFETPDPYRYENWDGPAPAAAPATPAQQTQQTAAPSSTTTGV